MHFNEETVTLRLAVGTFSIAKYDNKKSILSCPYLCIGLFYLKELR